MAPLASEAQRWRGGRLGRGRGLARLRRSARWAACSAAQALQSPAGLAGHDNALGVGWVAGSLAGHPGAGARARTAANGARGGRWTARATGAVPARATRWPGTGDVGLQGRGSGMSRATSCQELELLPGAWAGSRAGSAHDSSLDLGRAWQSLAVGGALRALSSDPLQDLAGQGRLERVCGNTLGQESAPGRPPIQRLRRRFLRASLPPHVTPRA
mmetsp:Transcript_50978/g.158052  ORF Transcript_50978/g.158052 Transcript_50978/m.158052 type:complete len:215 (+) Transcript_50978:1121-1765(+)